MFTIARHCGRCGNLVDFACRDAGEFGISPLDGNYGPRGDGPHARMLANIRGEDSRDGEEILAYMTSLCPRCGGPTLFELRTRRRYLHNINAELQSSRLLLGEDAEIQFCRYFPPPAEPDTDPAWPAGLVRQFSDAQRMLAQNMTPSIIIGTCRTVLDIATRELHAGEGETLHTRIAKLHENGHITKPIADWANAIRLDGNAAVHEGLGHREDAEEYIAFLKLFLNMAFSVPARIAARRNVKIEGSVLVAANKA